MADDGVLNKAQQKIRNQRIKAVAMKVRKDREAMAKRDAKEMERKNKMKFKEHVQIE